MPYPVQPSLALARLSDTSFSATTSGGTGTDTQRLFYRQVGATLDTTGPTQVGNGVLTVSGLVTQGQYNAFVVADSGSSYSLPSLASVSLASTDSLFSALQARFNAVPATVGLVAGGLWAGEVPEGTPLPYAWYDGSEFLTGPQFELEYESTRISFHVFALGYAAAETCVRQLKATYDYQSVPFNSTNATYSIGTWPRSWRIYNERIRWKDNSLIHRGVVNYLAVVQRSRAA